MIRDVASPQRKLVHFNRNGGTYTKWPRATSASALRGTSGMVGQQVIKVARLVSLTVFKIYNVQNGRSRACHMPHRQLQPLSHPRFNGIPPLHYAMYVSHSVQSRGRESEGARSVRQTLQSGAPAAQQVVVINSLLEQLLFA